MKRYLHLIVGGLIATVLLLCIPNFAQAEDASYQAMSDRFFTMIKQGKNTDAVNYLVGTNPEIQKRSPDDVERLRSQFGSLGTLMGSYISHAKLIETKVADVFVYQHYFVAYDRAPISIRIKYYKPGATWICYGLQFDAKIDDLIQQQADSKLQVVTQY